MPLDKGFVQGSTAPCSRVFEGSGMTLSSSMTARSPKPWHSGQAPCGLLNEKRFGIGVFGREPAGPALELLGKAVLSPAFGPDEDAAFPLLETHLERVGQPLPLVDAECDPVHENVERAVRLGDGVEFDNGAGDDGPGESVLLERGEAPVAGPGEGDEGPRPRGLPGKLGDDSVDRVADDRAAALETVDGADAGEEDAEEIEDLGDRGHGRARVLGGALLLDGDGRGNAFDEVGVGLVHPFEELAGVGGERFDVAALAFGVERVEGQGGLARAADPGDDDELVEGDVEIDPFQVVDPDTAKDDALCRRHGLIRIIHYNTLFSGSFLPPGRRTQLVTGGDGIMRVRAGFAIIARSERSPCRSSVSSGSPWRWRWTASPSPWGWPAAPGG